MEHQTEWEEELRKQDFYQVIEDGVIVLRLQEFIRTTLAHTKAETVKEMYSIASKNEKSYEGTNIQKMNIHARMFIQDYANAKGIRIIINDTK